MGRNKLFLTVIYFNGDIFSLIILFLLGNFKTFGNNQLSIMDHLEKHGMTVDTDILPILNETRKWTMFIAIIGFVGIGFLVVLAFSVGTIMEMSQQDMPFPSYTFTVIYLLLAVLYFFPVLYLYRFSVNIKKAIDDSSSAGLLEAFANLKAHYKFIGILLIVMLTFYVLAFIIGLIGGAMIF